MSDVLGQSGLFDAESSGAVACASRPLAVRMRPRGLAEVIGQDHIVGEDCLLPRLIQADNFGSLIFYGPPGAGRPRWRK